MVLMTRRTLAATLVASTALPVAACARTPGPRVQFWATHTGGRTFDAPDGLGNPFATALIEAMANPALDLGEASAAVTQRTSALTNGFQTVETPGLSSAPAWRFKPVVARERRIALIVTFYAYNTTPEWEPLPGAKADGVRVEHAFADAGFQTRLVTNPSRDALALELADFARRSGRADVAAIYCTGHGMEWQGVQYVMPCDHTFYPDGVASLVRAEKWEDIAVAACGRRLNLTIWAGCREYPPT